MAIYLRDSFAGPAGTVLEGRLADSGQLWDDTGLAGASVSLDGSGMVYLSNDYVGQPCATATMPSTNNFEVIFSLKRLSAFPSAELGVFLYLDADYTYDTSIGFLWVEGSGLGFRYYANSTDTIGISGFAVGPPVGTTWFCKIDITTTGSITTFQAFSSVSANGPWTSLGIDWSLTLPEIVPAVGFRGTNGPWGVSTGPHLGDLIVQDIPASAAPTASTMAPPAVADHGRGQWQVDNGSSWRPFGIGDDGMVLVVDAASPLGLAWTNTPTVRSLTSSSVVSNSLVSLGPIHAWGQPTSFVQPAFPGTAAGSDATADAAVVNAITAILVKLGFCAPSSS